MNILVDFDRTLYNSDLLYKNLIKICLSRSLITEDELLSYWEKYVKHFKVFNFFHFIEALPNLSNPEKQRIIKEAKKFILKEGKKFLYKDVKNFVKQYPDFQILTYGDTYFQLFKIKGCGISKSCKNIHIVKRKKWSEKMFFQNQNTVLIDDHSETIQKVKKNFPNVSCIEIKRPGTKYSNQSSTFADKRITSLSQLYNLRSSIY